MPARPACKEIRTHHGFKTACRWSPWSTSQNQACNILLPSRHQSKAPMCKTLIISKQQPHKIQQCRHMPEPAVLSVTRAVSTHACVRTALACPAPGCKQQLTSLRALNAPSAIQKFWQSPTTARKGSASAQSRNMACWWHPQLAHLLLGLQKLCGRPAEQVQPPAATHDSTIGVGTLCSTRAAWQLLHDDSAKHLQGNLLHAIRDKELTGGREATAAFQLLQSPAAPMRLPAAAAASCSTMSISMSSPGGRGTC